MPRTLVVIHVMKTGGFTLLYQAMANVGRRAIWGIPPDGTDELTGMTHYSSVANLLALDPQARADLRVVVGHLPFAAVDLLDLPAPPITATVVRHPVDRVLSYLAMCQARNVEHRDLALEEIYEDAFLAPRMIVNHQTKMLGMTAEQATTRPPKPAAEMHPGEEHPELVAYLIEHGYFDDPRALAVDNARFGTEMIDTPLVWPVPVTADTLANARRNLERVDILGVHEDYEDFLDRLGARMGWSIDPGMRVNAGRSTEVGASFRRRIEADNALDLELYELARELLSAAR